MECGSVTAGAAAARPPTVADMVRLQERRGTGSWIRSRLVAGTSRQAKSVPARRRLPGFGGSGTAAYGKPLAMTAAPAIEGKTLSGGEIVTGPFESAEASTREHDWAGAPSTAAQFPAITGNGHRKAEALGSVATLERRRAQPDSTNGSRNGLPAAQGSSRNHVAKAVSHVGVIPARSVATVGRAALMAAAVLRYVVTDTIAMRLPVGELIVQAWTLLKVTAVPAVLMAIPFGAMIAVQVSGLVNEVGANSLIGSAIGVGVVRQGAPMTAGLLMGGAAASAIAADFGARAIREELDALRTLGIDPVQRLVVPRFLALTLIAPILCTIVIASGSPQRSRSQ